MVNETPSRRTPLLGAILVLATVIAYVPALRAGFIWDDDDYVTENTLLHDAQGLGRIWIPRETPQYYPLVFTTFWIEYQLWELRPFGYHAVNVALHAMTAVLLWRLGRRLELPGAWMIAAVFALHPVHVESVAWVTERKNVLAGAFFMLALLAHDRFDGARPRWGWYAAALGLFVAAMLSKTTSAALPVVLVLIMLLKHRKIGLRGLVPLVPMLLIGVALGLHTAHLERIHVEAMGADFDFSVPERIVIASRALVFYPSKLLVPWNQSFIYPRWVIDADAPAA